MSIDFFNNKCKEKPRTDSIFGLCDKQTGDKAYSDISNPDDWIATVKNNKKEITFTPIDNCIIILKGNAKNKESTCDGMLTSDESIYLVELKIRNIGGWLPKAISQLKNTIELIRENHDIKYKYKKAFACNKKHPSFRVINNELNKQFFEETEGFRLDVQAEISIK